MDGRQPAKGKVGWGNRCRTQSRESLSTQLARLRTRVRERKGEKLTALYHHIYQADNLTAAYWDIKRNAAAGIDGETWQAYGEHLQENVRKLAWRLRWGAYRATPVRRVYIPKANGQLRPLGIPALEDKLVQYVTAQLFTAIWEAEFLGFSYGFRPGKNAHGAIDALAVGIERKDVRWVLDADVQKYYDSISHGWLMKFLQHRIGDKRVLHLIQKWLRAGVLDGREWLPSERGTPQGGLISPILANIYLHYAFDQWVQQWRTRQAHGTVIVVRYADDFVVGFARREDADRFREALGERLRKFELELHPEKTRLIEFGEGATASRAKQGLGKPETFNFLGFTHSCAQDRWRRFMVLRQTIASRMRAKLKSLATELWRRLHDPIPTVGRWLRSVVLGHYRYYGVPYNGRKLSSFRYQLSERWRRVLSRRSQTGEVGWERMARLAKKWLPLPQIYHPFPSVRLGVIT